MIDTDEELDKVIDELCKIRERRTGLKTSRKKVVDIVVRAQYAREVCR